MTDICEGRGRDGDIELLEALCETLTDSALCALGKSAPNPVLTTIRYFREEYESHIKRNICPAGVCKSLTSFYIDSDKCIGCSLCKRQCPVGAVSGELKATHAIDGDACISCGGCREVCRFEAVKTTGRCLV